jgi:hypothetical protein
MIELELKMLQNKLLMGMLADFNNSLKVDGLTEMQLTIEDTTSLMLTF